MKAGEIMTQNVKICRPNTNLAAVAMMMWDGDCGVIPVVDERQNVLGVITDRDICIATATKYRLASEITVDEVFTHQLYSCHPEDSVDKVLQLMKEKLVRRIPVVNKFGKLQGIISLNDIILEVKKSKAKKDLKMPCYEDVIETLRLICSHHSKLMTSEGKSTTHAEAAA